jgi:hypothetical protein
MFDIKKVGLVQGGAAAGAALLFAVATFSVSAQNSPTVSVGSAAVAPGANGTVSVQSQNMPAPGLGAWAMNIVYNPSIVQLASGGCAPLNGSVCNPNFSSNTIRITGAVAHGLVGDATLANLTFHCSTTGTSPLTLTTDTLADATLGGPRDIAAMTVNGSINCTDAPLTSTSVAPTTSVVATPTVTVVRAANAGFGPGGDGPSALLWIVAAMAGAGVAWLSAGLAGAALAAANASNGERQPKGFFPRMRPLSRRDARDDERDK